MVLLMILVSTIYIGVSFWSMLKGRNILINILLFFPTLIHEFGHIISTKILGGGVKDVVINLRMSEIKRTSSLGYAITSNKNKFRHSISAFWGYPFPMVMVFLYIVLLVNKWDEYWYGVIALIFIYYTIKTSKKLLPMVIVIVMLGLVYLTYKGRLNGIDFHPYVLTIPYILNGLLVGESLVSMSNMFRLIGFEGYDANTIKNYIHIPEIITVLLWYILIIGLMTISYIYYSDFTYFNSLFSDKFILWK